MSDDRWSQRPVNFRSLVGQDISRKWEQGQVPQAAPTTRVDEISMCGRETVRMVLKPSDSRYKPVRVGRPVLLSIANTFAPAARALRWRVAKGVELMISLGSNFRACIQLRKLKPRLVSATAKILAREYYWLYGIAEPEQYRR